VLWLGLWAHFLVAAARAWLRAAVPPPVQR
jgi:hypothetical protein